MNCAALPETLIEAELFGHEAGSFTGAAKTRHGRFEEADGGTLFLDELATLSSPAQDRLLRAVEYGEITRIGASQADHGSTCASSPRPTSICRALVDEGRFRADLLDRLSFEVVTLPPLRARSGDIPLLAEHFGRRMAVELEWPNWPGFSTRAVAELETYPWPGNVRELRNVVERAVYRAEDPERPIDAIQFDPFHSPWAPADSAVGVRAVAARPSRMPEPAAAPRRSRSSQTSDFRGAVTAYERALLEDALAPQPLQPARHRRRARPQLRPAAPRAEAPQAARRRRRMTFVRLSNSRESRLRIGVYCTATR